jgi:hypothetical protein
MSDLDPAYIWIATVAAASIVGIVRAWLNYRTDQDELQIRREELAARRQQPTLPQHLTDGETSH